MTTAHDPHGADPALTGALRGAVGRHGPHALTDPLALRLALRSSGDPLPPTEIDLLVGVAASGAVDVLREPPGSDDGTVLPDGALRRARTGTGFTATDAERACRAFADVMADAALPPAPGRGVQPLHWEDEGAVPRRRVATLPAARRRSRLVLPAAAALVLVLAAAGVLAAARGRAAPPPPPDRYAVDQVAQRHRALGATLLDGAVRCAPLAPEPGEVERTDCSFGAWSVVLASYDTSTRLTAARDLVAPEGGDHLREGRASGPGGTVTLTETGSDDGRSRSTAHWDTTTPRPMSATVTTSALPMPELVGFLDGRGFGGVARPELPGPEFRSGYLYRHAAGLGRKVASTCTVPPVADRLGGAEEEVHCTYANGATARFTRFRDLQELLSVRDEYATDVGAVPGTLRVGGWATSDPDQGAAHTNQLIEYVDSDDGDAKLYYDQESSRCLGIVTHPGLTQEQLRTFWQLG